MTEGMRTELVPVNRIAGHRVVIGRRVLQVASVEHLGLSRGHRLTLADGTTDMYYGTRIRRVVEPEVSGGGAS